MSEAILRSRSRFETLDWKKTSSKNNSNNYIRKAVQANERNYQS